MNWSLHLPTKDCSLQLLYNCYQHWVFFHDVGSHHWTAQVWVPCWPKPDRNQDVVLLRCKAETRESLWRGQLGDTHTWIRTLCRSAKCNYPDLKPFTYVGWFWCGSCSHSKYHQSVHSEGKLSLVLDVTGTRSNLLLYSVEMDILVSPQGSVFFSFFSLEKYCMQIILEILSVLFISFFPLTWVRIRSGICKLSHRKLNIAKTERD